MRRLGWCLAALVLIGAGSVRADVNILWYTGGTQPDSGSYEDAIASLVAAAPTAPGGNTWHVTEWTGGAQPVGDFNVLVVASPQGPWSTDPNYSALAAVSGSLTLGDRVMLTGQDADWHYMNSPGPDAFDNPKGFLLDSINWAGSGTGLGAVFLGGSEANAGFTFTGVTNAGGSTDDVQIPAEFASFPINTGLTSAGLSNWSTSAHETYNVTDSTLWTGINTSGASTTEFVTVVSAATGGGGISVPEPGVTTLMGIGMAASAIVAWRRRRSG
jgi:hypothetical protein